MKRGQAATSVVLVFLAAMCASAPQHHRTIPRLQNLSLEEKIGQLFVHSGRGVYMAESSWAYRELLHQVRDNRVGGIIWFTANVYETAHLNRRLQAEARVPLLISADLEAGPGMRFADTTYWPPAMAVGATGDPSLAEAEGAAVARQARSVGINHILAPVADVNVDPDNPVINARSFGEDPEQVGRFVAAFIRGVQSEHVLATAKHFPGHGDTHVDSHRALPVIEVSRDRLNSVELVPFRAAIAAGVGSVMVGHLAVPALDSERVPLRSGEHHDNPYGTRASEVPLHGTLPASISARMVNGLLRGELGYDGLVVSDAFDMGGIVEHFEPGEAAIRAIDAGLDQVMLSSDTDAAVVAVREAVKSGRLTEGRIDESVRRILRAKSFVGSAVADPDEIFRVVDSTEDRELAATIARRAITLVREQPGVLPLRRESHVLLVAVNDVAEGSPPLGELDRGLRARLDNSLDTVMLDSRSRDEELAPAIASAKNAEVIVVGLAVRARSGAGQIALPAAARHLIERLPADRPVVVIAFGTPYLLRQVPQVGTYLCAYGPQPVLQVAALDALFGKAPITGKLPVTIPGLYERGHGIQR